MRISTRNPKVGYKNFCGVQNKFIDLLFGFVLFKTQFISQFLDDHIKNGDH